MAKHLICTQCEHQVLYDPPSNPIGDWLKIIVASALVGVTVGAFTRTPAGVAVFAGIIGFSAWKAWKTRSCPSCGSRALIPAASPAGKRLAQRAP